MLSAKNLVVFAAALAFMSCGNAGKDKRTPTSRKEAGMTIDSGFVLKSSAFKQGDEIPERYGCNGADISPPLEWAEVPQKAGSLALIVDDPDAPMGTWVHWVIFNIPPTSTGLPEHVHPGESLPDGARQGKNDFRNFGYGGPCPPGGTHRYFFKLYALDSMLRLKAGSSKAELLKAMAGHVLAEAQLMGRYSR